ncbi:hypothetical protein NITLEN_10264 [Nitrospira lenta]|uniref:Uncharacterized protein n=1 Tax=Nitrospira lenta TaxID=1436998 RepID=A0A330L090_9BACT|nr:hypothetical protein NITLEN_10264 [Nitrospira lenta]
MGRSYINIRTKLESMVESGNFLMNGQERKQLVKVSRSLHTKTIHHSLVQIKFLVDATECSGRGHVRPKVSQLDLGSH